MTEMSFTERANQRGDALSPAEQRVVGYLREHAHDALFATAEQLGKLTGTSDATVVRTARTLGYSGLPELKQQLGRSLVDEVRPSVRLRQRIEHTGSDHEATLRYVFADATERLAETRRMVTAEQLTEAVEAIAGAREVFAFGVGLSALSAQYLVKRLNRLGLRAQDGSQAGFLLADELLAVTGDSCVVLYAPGRLLNECEVLLDRAGEVGADVVLVTDALAPVLRDRVRVCLEAAHAPAGGTSECLAALTVTDAVLLALAARDEQRAEQTSELLTRFREQLAPGSIDRQKRRRR
ncbi:MurR/RpiR family transcriptional regulator [Sciscionella sediminilitoris]|uniref:MurR/RpiR family transcriptional regulator n=1 Tax=Sciscionella sediminilitoris TaxID=1445613 RepID=UPI00068C7590|nr:MurR/RpiR family transcriptional regulator [Sciscionella sp. SE31]